MRCQSGKISIPTTEIVVSNSGSKTLDIPKGTVLKGFLSGQYRTKKLVKVDAVYVMHGDQKIEIDFFPSQVSRVCSTNHVNLISQ